MPPIFVPKNCRVPSVARRIWFGEWCLFVWERKGNWYGHLFRPIREDDGPFAPPPLHLAKAGYRSVVEMGPFPNSNLIASAVAQVMGNRRWKSEYGQLFKDELRGAVRD